MQMLEQYRRAVAFFPQSPGKQFDALEAIEQTVSKHNPQGLGLPDHEAAAAVLGSLLDEVDSGAFRWFERKHTASEKLRVLHGAWERGIGKAVDHDVEVLVWQCVAVLAHREISLLELKPEPVPEDGGPEPVPEDGASEDPPGIVDAIAAVQELPGLVVERCGRWLWAEGASKAHKSELKGAGFKWSPKKEKWYWRPAGDKRRKFRGNSTMPAIRSKYGSTEV